MTRMLDSVSPHSAGRQPSSVDAQVTFTGERSDFRKLIVRGAWLELITVGFYRFWLATDMRRHLWSHTSVGGDSAEYTGRARELLIGFLIALAILVPIYIVYFLIGLEAERLQAFASVPLALFLYLFGQFAIYRARRYRLSRTVWRGVLFWMTGSGWAYAWRAFAWGLLVLLTLGIAMPWRDAALERYKMRHSHYGNLQGHFEGRGFEYFKRAWWLWLLAWVSLVVPVLIPFVYAAYKGVQWRWWISGVRFGDVRFDSDLGRNALQGLYWKVIGWVALVFTLLAAYVFMGLMLMETMTGKSLEALFTGKTVMDAMPIFVLFGIGYLVAILVINVIIRLYLMRDLWARVASSVTVHRLDAAANVTVSGDLASAVGEGFAGNLDVVGI
jgi:uncharacterized membrane protein YjgN (DUF898 family)